MYSTTLVQYLYIRCYLSDNKPVLSYLLLRLLQQWWPRSGCTLCIVHCTVVHSHPHSHVAVISASRSLSRLRKWFFVSSFAVYTPLATTFTALFAYDFVYKSAVLFSDFIFLLEVSRELPRCSTLNTFFVALSFLIVRLHSLTLFALTFLCVSHSNLLIFVLFQTCHTFVSSSILLPYSGFQFLFFVGPVPNKPLDFASFFWSCKHDLQRFDLPCRCSSNFSGQTLPLLWGGTAYLIPPHQGPVCSSRDQITKT